MPYDPGWDMPEQNWMPQGSFESPIVPPVSAPNMGTLVCIPPINQDWLPIIQGCLDQLRIPATWQTASDDGTYGVLSWVDQLKGMFAMAGPCCTVAMQLTSGCELQFSVDGGTTWATVSGWDANFGGCVQAHIPTPVPVLPPGAPPSTRACNISGYLASKILEAATVKAVADFNANIDALSYASTIMQELAFVFPITSFAFEAFYDYYKNWVAANIAAFQAASTDSALWSELTCAIYNAIKTVGYITSGNLAQTIANICNLTYTYQVVITALCDFMNTIGLPNLQNMQNVGAVDVVDCTGCLAWCFQYDYRASAGTASAYTPGFTTWVANQGWTGVFNPGMSPPGDECDIVVPLNGFLIESFEMTFRLPDNQGGAQRELIFRRAGLPDLTYSNLPATGNGSLVSQQWAVNRQVDTLYIILRSQDGVATSYIQEITFRGHGIDPFGADNCT